MNATISRTDFESTIFARQPGLAAERFGAPKTDGNALAYERAAGIRALGTLVKAVINGSVLDFEPGSTLLAEEGASLKIPNLAPALLRPDPKTGKRRRIQDYAASVWQQFYVVGPLEQLVFLSVAPESHLRLVTFYPSGDGQPSLLLFEPRGNEGHLAIVAPGGYAIQ